MGAQRAHQVATFCVPGKRPRGAHVSEVIKPDWTRINVPYLITDTVRDFLIDAVELVAEHGHRLLPDYRFDPPPELWHLHPWSAR